MKDPKGLIEKLIPQMDSNIENKGQQGREKSIDLKSQAGHRRRLREKFIKCTQSPIRQSSTFPSGKDITKNLIAASNTMHIKVLDHIIIGDNKYFSFADEGLIEEYDLNLLSIKGAKRG
jgi:hypothetical protein